MAITYLSLSFTFYYSFWTFASTHCLLQKNLNLLFLFHNFLVNQFQQQNRHVLIMFIHKLEHACYLLMGINVSSH
jgi:hypothetical protein